MEILGVIPARGGSKSVPKKSIYPCAGKPMMAYTVEAAQHAKKLSRCIVSTDDVEMADVARSLGVEAPFMRPAEYAKDDSPDLVVFEHALAWLKENENYVPDAVVHLRPTTPLKRSADIDRGIELLCSRTDVDSVRSVCEPLHTPFKMYIEDETTKLLSPLLPAVFPEVFEKYPEAFNMPRQLLPAVWRHSGYVDIIRTAIIADQHSMSGTKILPLFFDAWRDIDIDSLKEITFAEDVILRMREGGKEPWQD